MATKTAALLMSTFERTAGKKGTLSMQTSATFYRKPRILTELRDKFEDFRRAYDDDGTRMAEFDHHGAMQRTLRQLIGGYAEPCQMIRDVMLPKPDE